jgi:hypothetical protein
LGGEVKLYGGRTPDGVDPNIALAAGKNFGAKMGVLHLKYEYDGVEPGSRIVKFAGAVLGKSDVAFSSAHVLDNGILDKNLKAWVGTAPNYNDSQGWHEISSFHFFKGWVNDGSWATEGVADIIALRLKAPISDTEATPVVRASAPVALGQSVTYCGASSWGPVSAVNLNPSTGDRRAGTERLIPGDLLGENRFYQMTRLDNEPTNVDGLQPVKGYSGNGVFYNNQLVGFAAIATTGNLAQAAVYLKTTEPQVAAFMDSFLKEAPDLKISLTTDGVNLSWTGDPTWRPQSKDSLTEGSWRDVTLPVLTDSAKSNTVTIPTNHLKPQQVFRLVQDGQ